jgi:hypothetical protein
MRDPERIGRILGKLSVFWHKNPDLRFGQLVECITNEYKGERECCIFYLEDDKFEEYLDEWIEINRLSS